MKLDDERNRNEKGRMEKTNGLSTTAGPAAEAGAEDAVVTFQLFLDLKKKQKTLHICL